MISNFSELLSDFESKGYGLRVYNINPEVVEIYINNECRKVQPNTDYEILRVNGLQWIKVK